MMGHACVLGRGSKAGCMGRCPWAGCCSWLTVRTTGGDSDQLFRQIFFSAIVKERDQDQRRQHPQQGLWRPAGGAAAGRRPCHGRSVPHGSGGDGLLRRTCLRTRTRPDTMVSPTSHPDGAGRVTPGLHQLAPPSLGAFCCNAPGRMCRMTLLPGRRTQRRAD